ncbi:hypothetical protein ACRBU7_04000 [Priestia aryabhattai]|uniref:hypothetical protein n=1 Tax=Priestia aryabhattai TaxID=412384 RepID=UPI003D7F1997
MTNDSQYIKQLKTNVLQHAQAIDGFKHSDILNAIMEHYVRFDEKQSVFAGFHLILLALEKDITLQDHTLLKTMINAKKQYAIKANFRHTYQELNAITLAIAYTRHCLRLMNMEQQYKSMLEEIA